MATYHVCPPSSSANKDTSAGFEKSERCRHVKPKPGTVVISVGYLLICWSNGRWKNTVHSITEPPHPLNEQDLGVSGFPKTHGADDRGTDDMTPARYSIPFFAAPGPEAIVQALPGCWSKEVPMRWKPISAGDYLHKKGKGMFA